MTNALVRLDITVNMLLLNACEFSPTKNRFLVIIRREDMIDIVAGKYNNSEAPVNIQSSTDLNEFMEEYSNLVRSTKTDAKGNEKPEWIKLDEEHCDFPFADLYAFAGLQKINAGKSVLVSPKVISKDTTHVAKTDNKTPKQIADEMIKGARRIKLR